MPAWRAARAELRGGAGSETAAESRGAGAGGKAGTAGEGAPVLRDNSRAFWAGAVCEGAAAVLAAVLCAACGLPVLGAGWHVSLRTVAEGCLWTVPFAAAFFAVEKLPTGIRAATDSSFRTYFCARSFPEIAVFCASAALGEELLFRSWLLAGLDTLLGSSSIALLLSSLVFGALHAYTRIYMALAFAAGLCFGYLFIFYGNSALEPLIVHFLYDLFTITVMRRKWSVDEAKAVSE